jgi:hypothetical protein
MKNPLDKEAQEALFDLLDIIASNVNRLMNDRFKLYANKPLALGKESGVGKATFQRILKGSNKRDVTFPSPNLKALIALSWRLDVPLQQLFTDQSKRARVLQAVENELPAVTPSRELKRRRDR